VTFGFRDREPLEQQIAAAIKACRDALAAPRFAGAAESLQGSPDSAQGWFDLLHGYPVNPDNARTLKRLKAAWPQEAVEAGAALERYAVLQAMTISARRILTEPMAHSVKRLYAELCLEAAQPARQWRRHFNEGLISRERFAFSEDGQRFLNLSWLATLQRYPAGDFVFDIHPYLTRSVILKVRPLSLPEFLGEIYFGIGGWGPMLSPHVHTGRANQLVLQKKGFERSLWRMAKTVEMRPDMKGLITSSWLHSAQTAELTPHLSWMRSIFIEGGAYLIDLESSPEDGAFKTGSARRRRMNEEGVFYPRDTLVLWRRSDMLSWAARRDDLADPDDGPVTAPRQSNRKFRAAIPPPVRSGKHNSPVTLWDGRYLLKYKPKLYVLYVMLLPCLAAALLASLGIAWWVGAPAFLAAFIFMLIFQYYLFQ
jgi:hypothetical protein